MSHVREILYLFALGGAERSKMLWFTARIEKNRLEFRFIAR